MEHQNHLNSDTISLQLAGNHNPPDPPGTPQETQEEGTLYRTVHIPSFYDGDIYRPKQRKNSDFGNGHSDAKRKAAENSVRLVQKRIEWVDGRTCTSQAREFILSVYPGLRSDAGHRRFFVYLVASDFKDEFSGRKVIPNEFIAGCYDKLKQWVSRNCRTETFLKAFQREVFPGFEWTGHHYNKKIAREAKLDELEATVLDMWRESQNAIIMGDAEDEIYFVSGGKYVKELPTSLKNKNVTTQEGNLGEAESHIPLTYVAPCSESRRWIEYLHSRHIRTYYPVRLRIPEAGSLAHSYGVERRTQAMNALANIRLKPKPEYVQCEDSVRIKSVGSSIQGIDRELRAILTRGWVEFDLKSAQLAVVATDWQLPYTREFLMSGASIWTHLARHMGLNDGKEALKKGVYTAVYGGGESTIRANMNAEYKKYRERTIEANIIDRFFTHPVIKEVVQATPYQLDRIERNKGAMDCFGQWLSIYKGRDEKLKHARLRSILAQLSQAREMQLLSPVLDMAIEEDRKRIDGTGQPEFEIMLLQHDGFTVRFRRKDHSKLLKRILKAVAEKAKELDMCTWLEYEE